MKNVVTRKREKRYIIMLCILITGVGIADLLGEFTCNHCNLSDPLDPDTQVFVHNDVKNELDLDRWDAGDYVLIKDAAGNTAAWGRVGAFSPISLINYLGNCGVSCTVDPNDLIGY